MSEDDRTLLESTPYGSDDQDGVVARPALRRIQVTDLRCTAPSSHRYFLRLQAGGEALDTQPISKSKSLRWSGPFTLPGPGTTPLFIQLWRCRWRLGPFYKRPDELIGQTTVQLSSFAQDTPISETLVYAKNSDQKTGSITFSYADADVVVTSEGLFKQNGKATQAAELATQLVDAMRAPSPAAIDLASKVPLIANIAGTVDDDVDVWTPLLDKLQVFVQISDAVASIHPYASMAMTIFNTIPKAMIAQKKLDDGVRGLVNNMNNALGLMQTSGPLVETEARCNIAKAIASQIIECGFFIENYARTRGFTSRLFENIPKDTKEKVDAYNQSFQKLVDAFQNQTIVDTNIVTSNVFQKMSIIESNFILHEMLYGDGATYDSGKACLMGTRTIIIQQICEWAISYRVPDSKRVLWLSGIAGAGKSAVAHSIAMLFDEMPPGRLGCFYGFSSSDRRRSIDKLFPTIARNIADMYPKWKDALQEVVKDSRSLRTTDSLERQFKSFLLQPAAQLGDSASGPILVVIDALDECGSEGERGELLEFLARLDELPENFRFLITSRPEPDICEALTNASTVQHMDISSQDGAVVGEDLARFVDHQLSNIERSRPALRRDSRWDRPRMVKVLVEQSDGSFLWASTSCRFIQGEDESKEYDWYDRLNAIVSSTSQTHDNSPQYQHLDSLYGAVLSRLFPLKQGMTASRRFSRILGRLLAFREPLSLSAFDELRGDDEDPGWAPMILGSMGSLLYGVTQIDSLIRPLHSSFREFLLDPQRSGNYHVDLTSSNAVIAHSSMRTMNNSLSFNMCKLDTSYLLNTDYPDMAERIQRGISPAMIYSSRHWAAHLRNAVLSPSLMVLIDRFLREKALFWLEALSVLGSISLAVPALSTLFCILPTEWRVENDRGRLIEDLQCFTRCFAHAISNSAPHIYISALPFSPTSSVLASLYQQLFRRTFRISRGRDRDWLAVQSILKGHLKGVTSIAFTKDGKHLVSGSVDTTIRLWDADTGEAIGKPFTGHTKEVTSLAFSPDGRFVVSGSEDRTLRIWDPANGQEFIKPWRWSRGTPTICPDGTHVFWYSPGLPGKISLWNLAAGPVGNPLIEDLQRRPAVAVSPSGKRVVLETWNALKLLWIPDTGCTVEQAFQGDLSELIDDPHQVVVGRFRCITFSPDETQIATGFFNGMVQLWDAETGRPHGRPLKHGVMRLLSTIAFSPDGAYLVTGCLDGMIQLWDLASRTAIGAPLYGHGDWITALVFSPDGNRIASASHDRTVRLWDAEAVRRAPSGSLDTHVTSSISISPDGTRIVSGSLDGRVRLWDARSGQAFAEPFHAHSDSVTSVAYSRDGRQVVAGYFDGTMRVLDAATGIALKRLPPSLAPRRSRPRPRQRGQSSAIKEWISPRDRIDPEIGHTDSITSAIFSSDGKRIFSASRDTTLRIWDVESGEVVGRPLKGHDAAVTCVAISPDGMRLISGSDDKKVRMWNATNGDPVGLQLWGHEASVTALAFSPDGVRFVSGSKDSKILLWDAKTHQIIGDPIEGHDQPIHSIAFSPDGMIIASGSSDCTLRMWDSRTGQAVGKPYSHPRPVTSVCFSPDGKRIVCGSGDHILRVWDVKPHRLSLHATSVAPSVGLSSAHSVHIQGNESDLTAPPAAGIAPEVATSKAADLHGAPSSSSRALAISEIAEHALRDVELLIPDADRLSQLELDASLRLTEDGWVVGQGGKRLMWIPHQHRERIIVHPRRLLLPAENMTTFDLSDGAHGPRWHECYTPPVDSQ
ncbi:hypothetical protein PUNSTDRAFT_134998 [Punctularia strigosozonata HHB-11173 SS5]|uniref:uncharacterized protein n=1 Tax=Punctularia strigosozonata (strain HHB-11173) TaxID=741275 RepID=UPI0004417D0A|nr:uncharacterized protein PUNSTDRAFT_134998 [Punctularia strigosozonata HHB-11173 SS5]EIN08621.1 hypothetical protein PUNSTDRAFT_134998 [Punctularia strigosozonata HHB-11173 SS5]